MKLSKESSTLWGRANKKTDAQNGIGDPADAFSEVVPVSKLIATINSDPMAIAQLARRSSELTEAQRTAFLKAYNPPEALRAAPKPKAAKAKPKAAPVSRSFLSGLSAARLGFGRGANS